MLNNPLPIGNLIQTFGSTIQIKVMELVNGAEFTDDIDNYYFNDEDPGGGEGEGEGGEDEEPILISNTGLNFVFNIKLCSHNTLTIND